MEDEDVIELGAELDGVGDVVVEIVGGEEVEVGDGGEEGLELFEVVCAEGP